MARSTRSRVCGATLGCPLMTRDTVWWETPARAATSDMTSARLGPSGSTVTPPRRGAGPWPPRSMPCRAAPRQLRGAASRASAGRAGAPLVVDVEGHGQQQHQALDHRLDGLVDTHELHAVAHDGHDQTADHGTDHGAHTAGDGRAADEGRGDRVELEHVARAGLGAVGPRREDDAGDRGQEAHVDEDPEVDRPEDRKSTRLNSSHANISYAVFC